MYTIAMIACKYTTVATTSNVATIASFTHTKRKRITLKVD